MDLLQNIPRISELSGHLLRLPTTDRGTLASLTSVPNIQTWTRAKADEYRQLALALLAIHNLVAPIHRLPTEVLAQILERCWYDRKSFLLPQVCHLWRSILLGRTAFWADAVADCQFRGKRTALHDNSELPFIKALLARSTQHSRSIKPSFFGFTEPIVESLTPYKSNVVSLHVTVGEDDLRDGLWPLLLSGMPNLRDLAIHLMITKGMEFSDDRSLNWLFDDDYSSAWMGFNMLSREELPQLSCLICPPNMLRRFGEVMLRQLKVEWWDESLCSLQFPTTDLDPFGPGGFELEPYRDSLETLEIRPLSLAYSRLPDPLELSSLRYLHVWSSTSGWAVSSYFSWLDLPQTTRIHITTTAWENPPLFHESLPRDSTDLRPVVSTIDHVVIQQPPHRRLAKGYHIQCFAGDIERLRMDDYAVTAKGLRAVFGSGNADVTHLTLSPESGDLVVDLHAFPYLEHLDVSGGDMETITGMLRPEWQTTTPGPLCPSLTELAITCGLALGPTPAAEQATSSCPGPDADTNVDELFRQKCSALQGVLAARASSGNRLTSLVLCLRPASILGLSESGSNHSVDDRTAKSDSTVWPCHAVRQSVLQSLRELVDGPVVFKLVDRAGREISVDEA